MPAVADYIIIKDAAFPADGTAFSFGRPSVAVGTKSILMFRMQHAFAQGQAIVDLNLVVHINKRQVLKLQTFSLERSVRTIHEVISEDPREVYEQQENTISFSSSPRDDVGSVPLPSIIVSDVVLWFQTPA